MATNAKPAANGATKADKQDYKVLSVLHHDGEPYAPGDTVSLTDTQAAALPGVVEPLPKAAEK